MWLPVTLRLLRCHIVTTKKRYIISKVCSEKVWSRHEAKSKDGQVLNLRMQELPAARSHDALEMMMNHFLRDEIIFKALDIWRIPAAVERLRKYYKHVINDPSYHKVICCSDTDGVKDIMGLSVTHISNETMGWLDTSYLEVLNSSETIDTNEVKFIKILYEIKRAYDPIKELKLDVYCEDEGAIVPAAYRGLGIGEQIFKVRRMMCEARKVPVTGAWMTGWSTQTLAAKDGWETVSEISYDYLSKKYDVNFAGAPPTMKFMFSRTHLYCN